MMELGWQAWLTLVTLLGVVGLLFSGRAPADLATLAGLGVLLLTGVVDVDKGLAGFSNRGVLTIGLLFVIAALVRDSGALEIAGKHLFASTAPLRPALLRLLIPTAFFSAFLNNTPVVALLLAPTKKWAEKRGFSATKILIPVSYAAILGGACTIIGTSTNLVVLGLMEESGVPAIGFFDIGLVGVPIALAGIVYLLTIGVRLLPERNDDEDPFIDPTTFTTEAIVLDESELIGTALADAQVGELEGLFPIEVRRGQVLIPAPQADLVLQAGDRLVLAGQAAQFIRLHRGDDLTTVSQHAFELAPPIQSRRRVVEVVLSDHSPLVGDEVGDGTFRRHYGAAVIAVSHSGGRERADVADWRLRAGDRLLLEAGDGFESHRASRDFFVVNDLDQLDEESPTWRAWVSLLIAIAMVSVAAIGIAPIFEAAITAAIALYLVNRTAAAELRRTIDWQVLLTIAAAFGIAAAVQQTGLAEQLAAGVVSVGGSSHLGALAAVYVATFILTEFITNNAAAALSFPLALAVAQGLEVSPLPFAIVVMIAASASFLSPLGYQTNLMVYGAGNYEARDFLRVGWPLTLMTAIIAVALTPIFFPF